MKRLIETIKNDLDKIFRKAPNEAWGLDIGESSVKLAHLNLEGGRRVVSGLWQAPIDTTQVDKHSALIAAIKEVMAKGNLTGGGVYVVASDEGTEIRRATVPSMSDAELREALRWELKDKISLDLDREVWDFITVGEEEAPAGLKKLVVLTAAVPRKLIDEIISITKEVGLTVLGINLAPFCLWNIINLEKETAQEGNLAVLDIGASKTNIVIFKDGLPQFTRRIKTSSSTITNAMTGVLITDRGRIELGLNEAERIKREYGIPENGAEYKEGPVAVAQIAPMIRPVLERLVGEIKRSFDYYSSQVTSAKFKKVLLVGGGSKLKNLEKFLTKELDINVEAMPAPAALRYNKAVSEGGAAGEDLATFAIAIGAGLSPYGKIDFLPHEFKTKKVELIQKISLRMVAVALASILAVAYFFVSTEVKNLRSELDQAMKLLATMQEVEITTNKINERQQVLNMIIKGEVLMAEFLKELSNITPSTILIEEVSFYKSAKEVVVKGVAFRGNLPSDNNIVEYIKILEKSPFTASVRLKWSRESAEYGREATEFELQWALAAT